MLGIKGVVAPLSIGEDNAWKGITGTVVLPHFWRWARIGWIAMFKWPSASEGGNVLSGSIIRLAPFKY